MTNGARTTCAGKAPKESGGSGLLGVASIRSDICEASTIPRVLQKIFGVASVFTKPVFNPDGDRWPWSSQVNSNEPR
jgi:hypothetical protein